MTDPDVRFARWLAVPGGLPCVCSMPAMVMVCGLTPRIFARYLRDLTGGKPFAPLTEWTIAVSQHCAGGTLLVWMAAAFCVTWIALAFFVIRARTAAFIALTFSVWPGVMLTIELILAVLVVLSLLLPLVLVTRN